jgi:alpha-1,3-rhamnosyl/mannosyltransferase
MAAMLRVAVNAVPLRSPLTGVGQYIRHLMAAIERRGDVEPHYFYASHWGREAIASPTAAIDDVKRVVKKVVPYPYVVTRMLQRMVFSAGMRRRHPDLYHEPNYVALPWDGPLVVTVHDLSFVHFPASHPAERLAHLERYLAATLARAAHVITDSETVRREAVTHFGLDPRRVTAIPLGVGPEFGPMDAQEAAPALARLGLAPKGYVLSVGTLEPRKNLAIAVRAWASLPEAVRAGRTLAIAGMKGWLHDALVTLVERLEREGIVRFLGYVPQGDLPALYAGALAMVYPSRYEGFGLPVVEAMASGVPVVAANASCLPEVAGDAALLVDPDDERGMAEALRSVLEDAALRDRLSARGRERARGFTWERCADETVAVYRAAAQSRK